jgi:hypothetical protein
MGSVPYGWRCSSLDPELPGGKQRSDCVLLRLATKHKRFTLSGRSTSQFSSSIRWQSPSRLASVSGAKLGLCPGGGSPSAAAPARF